MGNCSCICGTNTEPQQIGMLNPRSRGVTYFDPLAAASSNTPPPLPAQDAGAGPSDGDKAVAKEIDIVRNPLPDDKPPLKITTPIPCVNLPKGVSNSSSEDNSGKNLTDGSSTSSGSESDPKLQRKIMAENSAGGREGNPDSQASSGSKVKLAGETSADVETVLPTATSVVDDKGKDESHPRHDLQEKSNQVAPVPARGPHHESTGSILDRDSKAGSSTSSGSESDPQGKRKTADAGENPIGGREGNPDAKTSSGRDSSETSRRNKCECGACSVACSCQCCGRSI